MPPRYQIRPMGDRASVIDSTTSEPAIVHGRSQVGLTRDEAENLAALLNRMEARKPKLNNRAA